MANTIYKKLSEKDVLIKSMWEIVLRNVKDEHGNDIDDAGCEWFTLENNTYIGDEDWCVSHDYEVAELVNAINALNGLAECINQNPNKTEQKEGHLF